MRCESIRPAMLLLLILLLLEASAADTGTTTAVGTPAELMAALAAASTAQQAPNDESAVELTAAISLSPEAAAGYRLPLQIAVGHILALRGAGGAMQNLDFGGIQELLYMGAGSTLRLTALNLSGTAHKGVLGAQLGGGGEQDVTMPTRAEAFHLYPTVNGAPNFTAVMRNVNATLAPTPGCSPEAVAQQVSTITTLAGNLDAAWAEGTTVHVRRLMAPLPVTSSSTGEQLGVMRMDSEGTNSTCTKAPAGSGGSSSSAGGSSDGGGVPAWAWALVGIGAAALVAAIAMGAVLWRRRVARRQGLPVHKGQVAGAAVSSAGNLGSTDTGRGSIDGQDMLRNRVGFIEGLTLGPVLGGGAFGRVYRGKWRGVPVAVKVVPMHVGAGTERITREAILSMSLSHPNVVPAYKTCLVRVISDHAAPCPTTTSSHLSPASSPLSSAAVPRLASATTITANSSGAGSNGGSATGTGTSSQSRVVRSLTDRNALVEVVEPTAALEPGLYETWLVCEYADRGSLAEAIAGGLFRTANGERDMNSVLLCLVDVFRGLEHLHGCGIVHGDLKPHNVLLKSEHRDRRGWVCKLCDFGLSRLLGEQQTHVDTASMGTVSHAAPELLAEGQLSTATDIWAGGMVTWEVLTGQRAFAGVNPMHIIALLTVHGFRPAIPDDMPAPLADLLRRCWADDPRSRPTATEVVQLLRDCAQGLKQSIRIGRAASTPDDKLSS